MKILSRRIPTLLGLLFIGALVYVAYYFFGRSSVNNNASILPKEIRITNVADNKFSVSWITDEPTEGKIEYGEVGSKIDQVVVDDRDNQEKTSQYLTHHVSIEGLQPNTQYVFRIVSGDKKTVFDNKGSPYTVTTGSVIAQTPASVNFYGNVQSSAKQPATDSLVYLTLPGGITSSTVAKENGNYAFTLSTIRTSDGKSYVEFDPSATIANILVDSGTLQSNVNVTLTNSTPVPPITLGQNQDFMTEATTPNVAQVEQAQNNSDTTPMVPETPSIFNVEPLGEINAVTTNGLTILNPKTEGETLNTLRPEFRGTATPGNTISIALTGQKSISDTVLVSSDKTWSWAPVIDLKVGKQKITVSMVGSGGTSEKVERSFTVASPNTSVDPAFVSTPSATKASTLPTATASASAKASSTPRAAMPATDSGVPVTGVIENTLLTAGLGIVIMVIGAALLAL